MKWGQHSLGANLLKKPRYPFEGGTFKPEREGENNHNTYNTKDPIPNTQYQQQRRPEPRRGYDSASLGVPPAVDGGALMQRWQREPSEKPSHVLEGSVADLCVKGGIGGGK